MPQFPEIDSSFPFEMANLVNYARDDDIEQSIREEEKKRKAGGSSEDERNGGGSNDISGAGDERMGIIGQLGNIIKGDKSKDRRDSDRRGSNPVVRGAIPPSPRPTKDFSDMYTPSSNTKNASTSATAATTAAITIDTSNDEKKNKGKKNNDRSSRTTFDNDTYDDKTLGFQSIEGGNRSTTGSF